MGVSVCVSRTMLPMIVRLWLFVQMLLVQTMLPRMMLPRMVLMGIVLFAHGHSLHAVRWNGQQIVVLNACLFTQFGLLTMLVVTNSRNTPS